MMNLTEQVATGLSSAAIAVGITQALGPDWMGPLTGHQRTKTGTEFLERAKALLTGVPGSALTPRERSDFWDELVA